MTERTRPKTNPFTGTVVIEPPPSAPPATAPLPKPAPAAPPPPKSSEKAAAAPPPPAAPKHPLEGTLLLGDIASLVPNLPKADPDSPPATQAIPMRLNGPPVPFAAPSKPESERISQLPQKAPWAEVRRDVQPAQHALSGTIVDPPSQRAPLTAAVPAAPVAPAPSSVPVPEPAVELPPLPPEDPWGTQLKDVEPEPEAPPPQPAPAAPAIKLPERQEVKKGLYSRFFKNKG